MAPHPMVDAPPTCAEPMAPGASGAMLPPQARLSTSLRTKQRTTGLATSVASPETVYA
jgi:hypothetical protein